MSNAKRTLRRRSAAGLAALLALGVGACASYVAPSLTVNLTRDLDGEPAVHLTSSSQHERIEASLRQAGFRVVDEAEAAYRLRARLGLRFESRDCGQVRNVVWELQQGRQRVLELRARGATGRCKPNIFDELSAALAERFSRLEAGSP